jgi:hypothetical protein
MKKIFIGILCFVSLTAAGQRERSLQIDSDTLTRPTAPLYGLAVVDDTLYLVPESGNMVAVAHTEDIIIPDVDGLQAALDLKAPIASPTFTGTLSTPAAAITGLTTNYLPKVGTAGLLGNSLVYDNGSTVAIGTTTFDAGAKLHVAGTLALTSGQQISLAGNNLNYNTIKRG